VKGQPPTLSEPDLELPVTLIEARSGWQLVDLRELWRYRELLYFLTWRDVKVRYKQTVLGAAWAILQPFATMVVFSLFLGRVAGFSTAGTPYPLFVLAGILPWTLFAGVLTSAGQSVVGSQNLVTKVYFPRLIIPLSAAGTALVDFAVAFGMLILLMLHYSLVPGWSMVLVPMITALLLIAAVGVGTLLSALTVSYRDFRYAVPFGVQLWMFATPTIYLQTETFVGPSSRLVMPLNPAFGLIDNFRRAVIGEGLDGYSLAVSGSVGVLLLLVGCLYFRRVERRFADII
jgi:lipopolysaccharide transport system permease protein